MSDRSPEQHLADALEALGFVDDPEMTETAARFAGLLAEFRPGPLKPMSCFAAPGRDLVVLRGLPFYSLCAHHLLPFFGTADVAYVPGEQVAGFGGIARALEHFARRPQLQERLGAQLADYLVEALAPASVGIRLEARQLCMEMRGARSVGTIETLALRGADDPGVLAALRRG